MSGVSDNDLVFQLSAAQQVADLVGVSDNDLVFQLSAAQQVADLVSVRCQ